MTNYEEHPFDIVLKFVKTIRKLKSDAGLSSKNVDNVEITIKNNEYKLAIILFNIDNIKRLCKIETLAISYIDETNANNNLSFLFEPNK